MDGLYVAVATLTTSSILDPKLTITAARAHVKETATATETDTL